MNKYWLILILAMTLLACSSAEERKDAYLQKARELQIQGKFDKARLELKNALQIDPKDGRAWLQLGEMEEQMQNWRSAAADYQRVLELDSVNIKAKVKLGRLFLLGGASDRAESLAQEVLKDQPDNADALVIRAGAEARRKDVKDADHDVQAALIKDPRHIEAAILAASLAVVAGNSDHAVEVLKRAIDYHPEHTGLRAVLARVYAQQGKIDDGVAQLEKIIALEPEITEHRIELAKYYAVNKRPNDAEQVLRDALRRQPKQQDLQLTFVRFLIDQGKRDEAKTTLEQFIKESPDDYPLRFKLAELHLTMGKSEEARAVYENIISDTGTKPDGLKARNLLARLLILQGKNESAAKLLAEVFKENPHDNDALILRATLALSNQDAATAIADLREVLRDQPTSIPVLSDLARAHVLNDEPDLAIDAMQKAVEVAPQNPSVHVALAKLLAAQGQKTKALEEVKAALTIYPEDTGALNVQFKLEMNDSSFPDAMKTAQHIKTQQPGLGEYYLGLVSQAQKKNNEAISHFETALNKVPGATEPLSALVKLLLNEGNVSEAEKLLRKEVARSDSNVAALTLFGEVLLSEKKFDAAVVALQDAERLNPRFPTPYRDLAIAYMNKGNPAEAVTILQKGINATRYDPELVSALASYEANQDKPDLAIALYENALRAYPREPLFINNLAMMLVSYRNDKTDIDRAVELGERLKESGNPAYLDTLGWAYYRRGDFAAAASVLKTASRQAPDSNLLSYHLGMVYYQQGDQEAARRYLEKAAIAKVPYLGMDEAKSTLAKLEKS